MADRQKEEEEIAEAERRADEEKQLQQEREALRDLSVHAANGSEQVALAEESFVELRDKATEQNNEGDSGHENHMGKLKLLVKLFIAFINLLSFFPFVFIFSYMV